MDNHSQNQQRAPVVCHNDGKSDDMILPKKLNTKLFSARFMLSVLAKAQLPKADLPEIAFWGRSNCGKSSLLNRLVQHKQLARASRTPGRTRALNFFALGEQTKTPFRLIDMPGYGYAKAGRGEFKNFQELCQYYLHGRDNLKLVCLLIDARRSVMETDQEIIDFLTHAAIPFLLIVTKKDKITKQQQQDLIANLSDKIQSFPSALQELILTSAMKNDGIDLLRARISLLIREKPLI